MASRIQGVEASCPRELRSRIQILERPEVPRVDWWRYHRSGQLLEGLICVCAHTCAHVYTRMRSASKLWAWLAGKWEQNHAVCGVSPSSECWSCYAVPVTALVLNLFALSVAVSCGCASAQGDYVLSLAARCTWGQGTAAARLCLVGSWG